MERRHFLKLVFGVGAGAAALAATAQAAPIVPQPLIPGGALPPANSDAHPAVVTGDQVNDLKPEQVGWRHRHWGWRHRHWGWRRRHWRRWHRRHWRRRYW